MNRWLKYIPYALSLVWIVLSVIIYFSKANFDTLNFYFFNTDYLQIHAFYEDLVNEGGSSMQWSITPAPYFFPDMFLYFAVRPFCPDFLWAHLVCITIQLLAIVLLARMACKKIFPELPEWVFVFSNVLMSGLVWSAWLTREIFFSHFLMSLSNHTGTLINYLILLNLVFAYFRNHKTYYLVFIWAFSGIAFCSDKLLISYLLLPSVLTLTFCLFYERERKNIWVVMALSAGAICGHWLASFIRHNIVHIPKPEHLKKTDIMASINAYADFCMKRLLDITFQEYLWLLVMASFVCMAVLCAVYLIRKQRRQGKFLMLVISGLIISQVLPLYTGLWQGFDCMRYMLGMEWWVLFLFPVLLYKILPYRIIPAAFSISFVFYLLFTMNMGAVSSGLRAYLNFRHPDSELTDRESHRLKNGVGTYWWSRFTQMCSHKNIKIRAVKNDMTYDWHEASKDWYTEDKVFNFFYLIRPDTGFIVLDSLPVQNGWLYITNDFVFRNGKAESPVK